MTTFASRAEQSTLGALLYAPDRLPEVPLLSPDHFDDSRHQTILAGLQAIHAAAPDARGTPLMNRLADMIDQPFAYAADTLTGLALTSPEPHELTSDAQLVMAHAVRREIEHSAQRIQDLTDPQNTGYPFFDYSPLLHTMRRYETSTAPYLDPAWPMEPNVQLPMIRAQELVLAGLLQTPETVAEFADWLPVQAFTTPGRRDIYQTLLAVDGLADQPTSGFTLAAEIAAARRIAFNDPNADLDLDRYVSAVNGSYIGYLGLTPADPHTTADAGRAIVAEMTRSELRFAVPDIRNDLAQATPSRQTTRTRPDLDHDSVAAHQAHERTVQYDMPNLHQEPPF